VVWAIDGSIATLTFNRPQAKNALTWDMYDAIVDACDRVDAAADLRVLIIRGSGGAFAAGTDISQFTAFRTGDDGIAYEQRLDAVIDRIERLTRISIAAVDGAAVGGGCAIALACDLRVCSSRARFGVPVARTLGNCLSAANLARLVDAVGVARATELIFTARLMDADEASALGLARVVADDRFDAHLHDLATALATRASSTILATKALLQRIRTHRVPPPANDIIAACYGSDDFREGVRAFLEGRPPRWSQALTVSASEQDPADHRADDRHRQPPGK
jgi:enoyl-CoA hydratase/carnithine racemase